jgi:lysophospholipase
MLTKSEGFFLGYNNCRLHYKHWLHTQPKAHLIITHGQAEHADCYHRLIEALKGLPLNIFAWDLRGHGKSEGQRGCVKSFKEYTEDYKCFLRFLRQSGEIEPKDMILLGHSMGGLIQLSSIASLLHWKMKANILSSPLLGFTVDVPIYKDLAALIFRNLMPNLTMNNELQFSDVTSDEKVIAEMESDILRHDRISPGAYLGSIEEIEKLRTTISQIDIPTFIQIPEHDPVVDSEATKQFFQKISSSEKYLISYPNRKHEIYNDLGREEVFKDLVNFIQKIL